MDSFKNTVQLFNVTPAECQLLQDNHAKLAQQDPVAGLVKGEPVNRSPIQEVARLISKYGKKRVKAAFPGLNPRVPNTFEEARIRLGLPVPAPPPQKLELEEQVEEMKEARED